MKSLLLFLVCVLVQSNILMGQSLVYPNHEDIIPQRQSSENLRAQAHRSIKPSQAAKDQHRNPNTLQERIIGLSISENNIKKDSFIYFYNNNRGSQTNRDGAGTYVMYLSADTAIYYGKERGNFKIGWPNQGLTFNNVSNHNIRLTTYYDNNTPYDNYINTWDVSDSYVKHKTFKRIYALNGVDKTHDSYYQGTDYNKDGYGLRDTIIFDYSKHDKTLESNYTWTSKLDLDDQGRYKFQRRQNLTINTLTVDTNTWEYNAPMDRLSSYIEMTTNTDLSTSATSTTKKTSLFSYNTNGLVDTITILNNDIPAQLEVYTYNTYGLETNIDYFDYVNEQLQPTAKIVNDYNKDLQTAYTYYTWNQNRKQFVEIDKTTVTYDQNNNWDTTRVYKNQTLSYMLVHTFTKMNNIKTITKYEGGKITNFQNFTYEIYETTSTSETMNNLDVSVYPNPLSNELHVLIKDINNEDFNINIMNMSGKILSHFLTNNPDTILPLGQLSEGMYLMQISNKDKSKNRIQKIIKI